MGMQRTLSLQNSTRLIRVSKVMLLRTLNHHLLSQSAVSIHIFGPHMVSTHTVISMFNNQLALP